jgi:predicted YcjX-like family ATPase
MFSWMADTTRDAWNGMADYVDAAINETPIRIAVTGLSRAGKTVFITSLIHNLLALGKGSGTLPKLQAALGGEGEGWRLQAVRVLPPGSGNIAFFDYQEKLAGLAGVAPAWPPRTDDLARITLELLIRRTGISRTLGTRRVRLELLDYPGEWLLDLPLLSLDYATWSRQTLELLRQPPRTAACAAFLALLPDLDPAAPADDALLRQAHTLYRAGLETCRSRHGLRFLQPGRFICPGPGAETPLLWFAPLHDVPERPAQGTAAALMRDRFEAYKADMRQNFFDTCFAAFDRQAVLVDVLGTLHAGQAAFEDTERALAAILGASALAGRVMSRKLKRLAFVATKADHVPALRRDNLRNLLADMIKAATPTGLRPGVVSWHVAASVLATTDATAQIDGRAVEVVRGLPLGSTVRKDFHPGDVPSSRPPDSFWSDRYFELPVFTPPVIAPDGSAGIPHLGLDGLLAALLGDALS